MAIILHANFIRDVRDRVAASLAERWAIHVDASETESDVCVRHFALYSRLIEPRPRRVHRSRELVASVAGLKQPLRSAIDDIELALRNGEDVNHRLSRAVFSADKHDGLLNDWGIHHLHLGKSIDSDGFVERTNELLFVMVKRDDVYLLDVHPHKNSFERDELLHIVDRNWPRVLDEFVLLGVVEADEFAESTRKVLRRKRLNTAFTRKNGSVIAAPGGGYMTNGVSMNAVMQADELLNRAAEAQRNARARIPSILDAVRAQAPTFCGHEIVLRYYITEDEPRFAVREEQTRVLLPSSLFLTYDAQQRALLASVRSGR